MPQHVTLQQVSVGFERLEIDGERGFMLGIIDETVGNTWRIPIGEELAKTLVNQLTGVEVVTEIPPSLAAKMRS